MPLYTLLRQERTVSPNLSEVKVKFPPIREKNGPPVVIDAPEPEDAFTWFRAKHPHLREILLAVEPYSQEKHGRLIL